MSSLKKTVTTVSILIPAHNEARTIEKTLQALTRIQQDKRLVFHKIEIIVCSNNSTDDTVAITQQFSNILLVEENEVPGANAARQKAFEISKGEIVITLDADTVPQEEWFCQALVFFEDPEVISVAGICEFDNDYKLAPVINYVFQYTFFPILHLLTHNLMGMGGMMLAGNCFYRRESLEKIGGFSTDFAFWGDDAHTAQRLSSLKKKMIYSTKVRATTSSRRFIDQGFWKTLFKYIGNYLSVVTRKKPLTPTSSKDIIR